MPPTICLGFFCAMAASYMSVAGYEYKISFKALRTDLDLLLNDPNTPSTVNIVYHDMAYLHLLILDDNDGNGKYARIGGKIYVKYGVNGYMETCENVEYRERKFRRVSPHYTDKTYIVLKPNLHLNKRQAGKTLNYISLTQLTQDLKAVKQRIKRVKINNLRQLFADALEYSGHILGLSYDKEVKHVILDKPLKGISLKDNEVSPEVLYDVWYHLKSGSYGTSSGSFDRIDTVRIFVEDHVVQPPARSTPSVKVGEDISRRMFVRDIENAYETLQDSRYENVVINYADETVWQLQRNTRKKYIYGTGTAHADANGKGRTTAVLIYDFSGLKYWESVQSPDFQPIDNGPDTFRLKYVGWDTFARHFEAVWKALQGGCTGGRERYTFSIFYGQSIPVHYRCQSRNLIMDHKINLVRYRPQIDKTTIDECDNVLRSHKIEVKCLWETDTPVAIQQKPKSMWMNFEGPISISLKLLTDEVKELKDVVTKNGRSWRTKPQLGTIILDDAKLFQMELPADKRSKFVNINAEFTEASIQYEVNNHPYHQVTSQPANIVDRHHKTLRFYGAELNTEEERVVEMHETFLPPEREEFDEDLVEAYIIASKYLTVRKLKKHLEIVSKNALHRCKAREVRTNSDTEKMNMEGDLNYAFKLVYHNRFGLEGFYSCSGRVFLFEGTFRALLYPNMYNYQQIRKIYKKTVIQEHKVVKDLIYVEDDQFFIPGRLTFEDVYAIQIPPVQEVNLHAYGAPYKIDDHSFILLQSKAV